MKCVICGFLSVMEGVSYKYQSMCELVNGVNLGQWEIMEEALENVS